MKKSTHPTFIHVCTHESLSNLSCASSHLSMELSLRCPGWLCSAHSEHCVSVKINLTATAPTLALSPREKGQGRKKEKLAILTRATTTWHFHFNKEENINLEKLNMILFTLRSLMFSRNIIKIIFCMKHYCSIYLTNE